MLRSNFEKLHFITKSRLNVAQGQNSKYDRLAQVDKNYHINRVWISLLPQHLDSQIPETEKDVNSFQL